MTLILTDRSHPLRSRLERTIRAVFLAEYGAHVPSFPERLVALLDGGGAPSAVAGLRFAGDGLFSEVYLGDPAHAILPRVLGHPVDRDRIVEFSSLVAPRAGAAMPLVIEAIRLCRAAGAEFGIFTATERLRALLGRSRLPVVDLGPARPERLAHAAAWGSYYLHAPRVLAVAAAALPAFMTAGPVAPEVAAHA